ncbi:MAG: membrane protein insertion efficiency factor YidD [Armatimonadota bacterium]
MRHILVFFIRIYQAISRYTPRVCRYEPTCSEYAVQAIKKYGPFKGLIMAVWRILRCNPWSPGGFDPVE